MGQQAELFKKWSWDLGLHDLGNELAGTGVSPLLEGGCAPKLSFPQDQPQTFPKRSAAPLPRTHVPRVPGSWPSSDAFSALLASRPRGLAIEWSPCLLTGKWCSCLSFEEIGHSGQDCSPLHGKELCLCIGSVFHRIMRRWRPLCLWGLTPSF